MLYRMTYVSLSLVEPYSAEVMDIARCSLRRNRENGVTGALYYDDAQFFQVIEGDEAAVRALFDRIRRDARHTDVTVLSEGPVSERLFPDWAMKFLDGAWIPDGPRLFDHAALSRAPSHALSQRIAALAAT
jgi:Sensors of blue-light using FAD